MDIRKHMLAYFERTCSANKNPAGFDLASALNSRAKKTEPKAQNIRKNPLHIKNANSGSLTTKSDSIRRSPSSRASSNRSSRLNSPAARLNSRPMRQSTFRDSVLNTINELMKVRSLKISKHVEMVTKEVRLIKKLKILIGDEIKLCKKQEDKNVIEDVNEKLSLIMKQSAEELLMLENQIKLIIEENVVLKKNLEGLVEKKKVISEKNIVKKVEKKVSNIQECLDELIGMDKDSSTILVEEPERSKNYLNSIDLMAEKLMEKLSCKDPLALPGVLALQISREKMLFEQPKKQNQDSLDKKIKIRKRLERKLKKLKKTSKTPKK
jgi:hypothetical protein